MRFAGRPTSMRKRATLTEQHILTGSSISTLRGDVSKLPPATVITADIDPLRSEGEAFADKLRGAGIDVKCKNYDGVTHEFFGLGASVETAKHAERFAAEGLDSAFEK